MKMTGHVIRKDRSHSYQFSHTRFNHKSPKILIFTHAKSAQKVEWWSNTTDNTGQKRHNIRVIFYLNLITGCNLPVLHTRLAFLTSTVTGLQYRPIMDFPVLLQYSYICDHEDLYYMTGLKNRL